jgi:hypothetical protein
MFDFSLQERGLLRREFEQPVDALVDFGSLPFSDLSFDAYFDNVSG